MADTIEKIYCTDGRDNDLAAILAATKNNDPATMMAAMGGGMNNWMNNPFVYLVWMMFANRMWGGEHNCNPAIQAQIDSLRNQMADNQNSNLLMDAVHGNTAAEVIVARADHNKEHMGLKSWKNAPDGKIVKTDVSIAKNYLEKEELAELNEIVTMYLDYATRQARRHIPMTMEDWKTKLDAFLRFNDADVLQDKGKVTAAIAKEFAESEFEKYRVIQDSLYESDFDKLMNDMEKNDAIH